MKCQKNFIIHLSACLLLIGLGLALVSLWNIIAIGVSYKAKILCSGVFVSRRSPQSVLGEDLEIEDLAPLQFIGTKLNLADKIVSASFFGLLNQQAVYHDKSGCTLVSNKKVPFSLSDIALRPTETKQSAQNVDLNPLGINSVGVIAPIGANDKRFDAVLDWAFAEPDSKHLRRTRAVVIMQNGKVIAERYAPGFTADMPLPGWSTAKSIMNAFIGILVGQGKLDLNAPAPVPEWQGENDPRREITLDQLMRMQSGLEFSESAGRPLGDVTRMLMLEPDAAAYAANKPLIATPGTYWAYASGTTNILSRIIRKRLGDEEYREFPRQVLFVPLGMNSAVLETDASGTFIGSSFLYATARDWAKFGQLYLQDGIWQGNRILPSGWVTYSTTLTANSARQFAAHFWLDFAEEYRQTDPEPLLPPDAFHAMGYEGQCVSIIPSWGLVVVRLGLTRTASAWRQDRFVNRIISALSG
jgi:CubicO group peptidase (beta-lactamase class C family)